jgi:flagellin
LEQALQNVSDAKSVLDIVESSYNSIMDNLIEMKRLGLQAANDTLSRSERTLIAQQIHGHGTNINDIANSTYFNGIALNPTTDTTLTFQTGEGTSDTESITLRQVDILGLFGPVDTQLGGTQNHIDIEINITQLSHLDDDNDDRGEIAYLLIGGTQVKADGGDFKVYSGKISEAIDKLNGYLNEVGINQRSLSSKEENLTQAITANSAAHSRIMDTDFAKEQSNSIRLQILQQTATAALSQANMGPQAVLGFLGQ